MANSATYNRTKIHFAEGAAAATPDAGEVVTYAKADGLMYSKDDAGVETLLSSGPAGSVATDTIWDTKGDLAAATGADAAAKLAAAANGSFLRTASGQSTGLEWQLNNLAAAVAPAVTDDSGDGYSVGSRWIDTTADKEYVCLDATVGAAVWTETTGGGGGTLAYEQAYLGADAATSSDSVWVDGPAVTCAAGTWLVMVEAYLTTGAPNNSAIRVYDGTTVRLAREWENAASGSRYFSMAAVAVLASSLTLTLQVACNYNPNGVTTLRTSDTGLQLVAANKATNITAVQIA